MKRLIVVLVLCFPAFAAAQTGPHKYNCLAVSVTSRTTPVQVLAPTGNITTWYMENSSTPGNDPVLVFPFDGPTAPASVPSPDPTSEIPSGGSLYDSVNCDNPACRESIGQGWAAVLATGSTATTLHVCSR